MGAKPDPWHNATSLAHAAGYFAPAEDLVRAEKLMIEFNRCKKRFAAATWKNPEDAARLKEAKDRLFEEIHDLELALVSRLIDGELIAAGFFTPISVTSERRPIPAHLWNVLEPACNKSTAKADALKVVGIVVIHRDALAGDAGAAQNPTTYRTGAPGRPGSAHLIRDEFKRRIDDGRAQRQLALEVRELGEWLQSAHPLAAPLKPKTIGNTIRVAHRAFRQTPPK